jgi:hypothetical protein
MDYTENWTMTLNHDGTEYRVVWAELTDGDERELIVLRDGEYVQRGDDIAPAKDAATAFRISQLQREYDIDPFTILSNQNTDDLDFDLDNDLLGFEDETEDELEAGNSDDEFMSQRKAAVLELAERSFKKEFLGQYSDELLYLQTVARILQLPESSIFEAAQELVAESKVGLSGNILVPFKDNQFQELFLSPAL